MLGCSPCCPEARSQDQLNTNVKFKVAQIAGLKPDFHVKFKIYASEISMTENMSNSVKVLFATFVSNLS